VLLFNLQDPRKDATHAEFFGVAGEYACHERARETFMDLCSESAAEEVGDGFISNRFRSDERLSESTENPSHAERAERNGTQSPIHHDVARRLRISFLKLAVKPKFLEQP
jgi:hypothetical protein